MVSEERPAGRSVRPVHSNHPKPHFRPRRMARMEMPKFLLFTIIGSTVWNILLVGTGAAVGVAWEQAAGYVKMYADIVFLVLAAGAVCFPAVHLYRKKHK